MKLGNGFFLRGNFYITKFETPGQPIICFFDLTKYPLVREDNIPYTSRSNMSIRRTPRPLPISNEATGMDYVLKAHSRNSRVQPGNRH